VARTLAAGDGLVVGVRLFDVYRGPQVPPGRRSLAFSVRLQAPDRTLTDDEVARRRAAIESALADLGGKLRA
jgi:phenylalanyl-tRNA synthetase beta chain